jgi:RHS repeat-associated protein
VTNTYDLLGRITRQTHPQSDTPSAPDATTTFAYAGRTQTVTDPNGKVSTKTLDVNGWMRESRDADSAISGYYQKFRYDAAGSLEHVDQWITATSSFEPLFSATYSYGAGAFQTATTDMDLGSWTATYNSLGEKVSWTDAATNSFSQSYDALSRVVSRTDQNTGHNEGTTTWTWGTSSGSHNIGRLASVSMTNYSESLSYDSIGRPSTQSITADGSTYAIDTAYNNQGSLDSLTYPTSNPGTGNATRVQVKYGYAYGILQTVTDWTSGSAGTVYWTANTQNARGQTTQETLGNGVVTNRNFDAVTGWLNTIQSGVSGGTGLQNQAYAYDKIGNITQRQENTQGLTENFYYDNLYRLTSSQVNSNTAVTYAYNAMGNITSRSDVNGGATWTYDSSRKHAVANTGSGGASYSYDANGNMTSRDGQSIGWTSYNYAATLATATENTTFYYGPDRQYYRQDYNGPSSSETTYYIGGLLEKVCPSTSCASGTIDWRHYIVVNGQRVAIVSRKSSGTNTVNYVLEDNQGSSSVLTSSTGANLVRVSYNPLGLQRDGADWDGSVPSGDLTTLEGITRRGYTGHSMLGRMGLIHMNGRVQDASTGRFLSPDPTIPDAGFTQSYNRYAYVNNNPMSYTDPSGFTPHEVSGTGGMSQEQFMRRYQAMAEMYSAFCGGNTESPECWTASQEWGFYQSTYQGMMVEMQAERFTSYVFEQRDSWARFYTRGESLEEVVIAEAWKHPGKSKAKDHMVSPEAAKKLYENSLYTSVPVSPALIKEIDSVLQDSVFRKEAWKIWSASEKEHRELGALSVYEREGNYYAYSSAFPDATQTNKLHLSPVDPSLGRHVFDWHPHPSGNPNPSPDSDLKTSYGRGDPGVIRYADSPYSNTIYQGGCKPGETC